MNIYDFDDTIYDGDTGIDIIKYSLIRHPFLTLRSLFKAAMLYKKYRNKEIELDLLKENLLKFVFQIKNHKEYINKFVESHMKNIKPWYKERQTDNDILATASYDLWIDLFAKNIGIKHVICTKTDDNGCIVGKNCKGEEKVIRLKKEYPKKKFVCAYSDSAADIPILELADKAYVVEGNELLKYKKGFNFKRSR